MFFHSLDTEDYFIVCKNKFGHRNNYFQNYGNSGRLWAMCFVNQLPLIHRTLRLLFPLSLSLSITLYYVRIWKTVNQVGLLGSLESAFGLITHTCCCIHQVSLYVSFFIIVTLYHCPCKCVRWFPCQRKEMRYKQKNPCERAAKTKVWSAFKDAT